MERNLLLSVFDSMLSSYLKNNQSIGREGEKIAETYLLEKGYEVLERNWRSRRGEVDLILFRDKKIVFVEVKTRRNSKFGSPHQAIDFKKQRKMVRGAIDYLQKNEEKRKGDFSFQMGAVCISVLSQKIPAKKTVVVEFIEFPLDLPEEPYY